MTFEEWITSLNIEIVYCARLTVKSSSETKTLYVSTHAGVYDNQYYEPYLVGIPRMSKNMQEIMFGRSQISWGDLVLFNGDGFFDDYINSDTTWTLNGQEVVIEAGKPDWSVHGTIFKGYMKDPEFTDEEIRIPVYDAQYKLENIEIPPNEFDSTSYPNAPTSVIGRPIPLCFGYCYNITPVLIDDTNYTYKVHDGQINDVTHAYDDGVEVTIASKDLTNGTFRLSAAPVGTVTCDVEGAVSNGSFLTKPGEIVEYMLKAYANFSDDDIDSTYLSNFNTDVPWPIGVYVMNKTQLLDVIDMILVPLLSAYGITRDGKFRVWQFKEPTSSSSVTITDMEGHEGEFKGEFYPHIYWKVNIGYDRNWTIQTTGLGGSVGLSRKEWLKNMYRYTSKESSSTHSLYGSSKERTIDTFLKNKADAETLADRYLSIFGQKRMIITDKINLQVFNSELNDNIKYERTRYNLDGYYRLISIEENYEESETVVTLWG